MNIVKILCGILLVGMATFVHGGSQSGKRCAYYMPDWVSWEANAPVKCKPWSGCSTGDMTTGDDPKGRCTGYVRVEIDDVSTAYPVMSCKADETGSVYKCKDFHGVKCVDDGKAQCLKYRVYYSTDCIENDAFPAATRTRFTNKCYSDTSGG